MDEIVCSEECWAELVQATLSAGGMEPQREDPNTSRKFLLRTPQHTSTRPTLYPSISPSPHIQVSGHSTRDHASPASDRRRKRSRPPQAEPPGATEDSATSEPLAQQQPALEATPQPQKRRRQVPQRNTMEAVPAIVTADAATTKARTTEPVPQRWIALEPSPRPAKQRRRHTEHDTGTEAITLAIAAAAGTVPAEPVLRRWVTLEGSPRPTKRQRTAQTEASSSTPPTAEAVTRKRKRREDPTGRSN